MGGNAEAGEGIGGREQLSQQGFAVFLIQSGESSAVKGDLPGKAPVAQQKLLRARKGRLQGIRIRAADLVLIAIDALSGAALHGQEDGIDEGFFSAGRVHLYIPSFWQACLAASW